MSLKTYIILMTSVQFKNSKEPLVNQVGKRIIQEKGNLPDYKEVTCHP